MKQSQVDCPYEDYVRVYIGYGVVCANEWGTDPGWLPLDVYNSVPRATEAEAFKDVAEWECRIADEYGWTRPADGERLRRPDLVALLDSGVDCVAFRVGPGTDVFTLTGYCEGIPGLRRLALLGPASRTAYCSEEAAVRQAMRWIRGVLPRMCHDAICCTCDQDTCRGSAGFNSHCYERCVCSTGQDFDVATFHDITALNLDAVNLVFHRARVDRRPAPGGRTKAAGRARS